MKQTTIALLPGKGWALSAQTAAEGQLLLQPRAFIGVADYSVETNNCFKVKGSDTANHLGLDASQNPEIVARTTPFQHFSLACLLR